MYSTLKCYDHNDSTENKLMKKIKLILYETNLI